MDTVQIILICIACLVVGYMVGFEYSESQWRNCAYKKMIMRVNKRFLFEVNYLGEE